MVERVRKYPGEVGIYAAGFLTNDALVVRLDPTFARNAKQLVIMGGYINMIPFQVTSSVLEADVNSDINLKIDPEAAKIALTADSPNITLVGDTANAVFMNSMDHAELPTVNNLYTEALITRYFLVLPVCDPTALAVLLNPGNALTNSTQFYVDVDVAWVSPYHGKIRAYQKAPVAMGQQLRIVTHAFNVNVDIVKSMIKQALMYPGSCADV